jgi:hypothetical protein
MSQPVFIFKIALAGAKRVWRRIAVRGTQTLDDLHEAIYNAFDRYDEHLYSFYFPKPGSKGRARIRDGQEYTCSHMLESPGGDEWGAKSTDTKLTSLGLTPKSKFYYLFDFGDEWWHEITVEKTAAPSEKGKYPRILETHGPSPPQYPDADEDEEDWDKDEEDESA